MNRPLTEYFKAVRIPQSMSTTVKRKLSLTKNSTPQKSVKVSLDADIIDLASDDEETSSVQDTVGKKDMEDCSEDHVSIPNDSICEEASNSSASTIIYTPSTPRKSQTPRKSHTPQSSYAKSPASREKFFSPVKKRNLKLRSPSKVKKNLYSVMDANEEEDQFFLDACQGMDDKTVFLLNIIYKYLTTNELEPLLLKASQDLLSKCMNTKKPGMRLVCRLYWRKEGWYRQDQIKEISRGKNWNRNDGVDDSTIQDMIDNLTRNDIIESTNCNGSKIDIGFEDCLTLLKLDELKSICKELKIKTNNKQDASECLRAFSKQKTNISSYFVGFKSDNASRTLKMLREKAGPCFRLTSLMRQTLNELYQLMYLGISPDVMREKKLELILINDKIKRECYPDLDVYLDNASVVFGTRDEFERYLQAQNIYEEFLNTEDLEKCQVIENVYNLYKSIDQPTMRSYRALPLWLQRFTPPYLYVKILEAGLQELKKMKTKQYIALAIDISTQLISQNTFRQHKKAEWYAEKALILDKFMSDSEQAARVLLEGFNSDLSEIAKDCLRPRAMKMATRKTNAVSTPLREDLRRHSTKEQIMENNLNAKHIYKHPMDINKNRGKIKFETRTAEGRVVQDAEEFCIDQYIKEGKYTHGGHWEGKIVTTMFFLLFWDIIYAKLAAVRGLFLTHYQMFPLDLYMESFYVNRKAVIEERLKEIAESSIEFVLERMSATWDSRPEGELSGISRQLGWENVSWVARCLGARPLAALCRRLAGDYGYTHSGFPDLTLWNVHTREVKFVEVKTDSDKPSMKQKQWMHYLRENGIETEFCYVGVDTSKCKARNSMNNT